MNNIDDLMRAVYDRMRAGEDRHPPREVIRFEAGWIAAAVIPAVVLTLVYIMCGVAPFDDKLLLTESTRLWFEHFERFRAALTGGGSFFYSFGGGFGGEIFSDFRSGFFSPFTLLCALFSSFGLPECLVFMTIFRSFFAGMFAYLLLMQFSERNALASLALSTGYASGSLFTLSFLAPEFADAAVFLPLAALGLALLSARGSVMPLFFGLAFFLLTTPTLWPALAVFCVTFFIWCNMIFKPANIASRTGMMIFCVAIAVGADAAVLVPSLVADIERGSVIYPVSGVDHASVGAVLTALVGGFTPQTGSPAPLLFASSLTALLVPVYLTTRRISLAERQTSGFFLFFILLSMIAAPLASIWLFFSKPTGSVIAFSCIYTVLALVMSSRLCALENAFKTGRMLAAWMAVLLAFSVAVIFGSGGFTLNNWIFSASFLTLTAAVALAALAGRTQKLGLFLLLLFIICFDCVAGGMLSVSGAIKSLPTVTRDATAVEYTDELTISNQIAELENNRDIPFRVRGASIDGLLCLDSPVNATTSSEQLCRALGIKDGEGFTPVTDSMLGIRYVVLDHTEENTDYGFLGMNHGNYLYHNPTTLALAFPSDRTALKLTTYSTDPFVSQNLLATAVAGADRELFADSAITGQQGHGCSITGTTSGYEVIRSEASAYVEYRVKIPTDGALYMYIDEKQGAVENIAVNGNQIGPRRLDCINRLGVFERGDEVTIYISVSGDRLTMGGIWFATLAHALSDAAMTELAQRPSACSIKGNKLNVTAVMSDTQFLMTTIPWSSGWRVTVDGVKKTPVCAAGSFLGVETGPGTHSVCFEYVPSDLPGALIISALSFLIALVFMLLIENNRRKAELAARAAEAAPEFMPPPPEYYAPPYAPVEYMPPACEPEPDGDVIPGLVDDDPARPDEYGYYDDSGYDDY